MSRSSFVAKTVQGEISVWVIGNGPAVLLLHGGPGISDYMQLLETEAAAYTAVGFQQRGLAPSALTGPFSVERHVADAVAVLEAVHASDAIAAGHSWGGHLALQLALVRPDLIAAVVVIDSLGVTGDGGTVALHDGLRARLAAADRARCDYLDQLIGASPDSVDRLALEQLRILWPCYFAEGNKAPDPPSDLRICVHCNEMSTSSVMRHLADGAFVQRLRGLQQPVVALAGQQSPMPTAISQEIANVVPAGELLTVPAAGHLPWVEQPGCVRRALARAQELARSH